MRVSQTNVHFGRLGKALTWEFAARDEQICARNLGREAGLSPVHLTHRTTPASAAVQVRELAILHGDLYDAIYRSTGSQVCTKSDPTRVAGVPSGHLAAAVGILSSSGSTARKSPRLPSAAAPLPPAPKNARKCSGCSSRTSSSDCRRRSSSGTASQSAQTAPPPAGKPSNPTRRVTRRRVIQCVGGLDMSSLVDLRRQLTHNLDRDG